MRSEYPATLEIGETLTSRCSDFAAKYARSGTITVTCAAETANLPCATAIQLNLIAAELLGGALAAFACHRGGRIGIFFDTTATGLELTVEHSRPTPRAASRYDVAHSWLARTLVARMRGRIEHQVVIGGARTVVTVPRF